MSYSQNCQWKHPINRVVRINDRVGGKSTKKEQKCNFLVQDMKAQMKQTRLDELSEMSYTPWPLGDRKEIYTSIWMVKGASQLAMGEGRKEGLALTRLVGQLTMVKASWWSTMKKTDRDINFNY